MIWRKTWRADPQAREIADRHYNRQTVGAKQFVPPGRCVVLISECGRALWVTSWPFAQYVKHAWAGAWINSLFRNEGAGLSSELIIQAIAVTRFEWEPPTLGMITFVDRTKVRSTNPGYCYLKAGFEHVGETRGGLMAYQLRPDLMPIPQAPVSRQMAMVL